MSFTVNSVFRDEIHGEEIKTTVKGKEEASQIEPHIVSHVGTVFIPSMPTKETIDPASTMPKALTNFPAKLLAA